MKKLLAFALFSLTTVILCAQTNYQDVVYLKNGSIIRGVIIEQVPNQSISIQTADKSVFVFQMDEIERIAKEAIERESRSKINVSLRAGLNLKTIYFDDDVFTGILEPYDREDIKMTPGFHIGIKAEYPISDIFSLESGLLLSNKGYKFNYSFTREWEYDDFEYYLYRYEEEKLNLFYLEIPLSAKASFDLGDNSVFGILGPYISMGVSGRFFQELGYDLVETWGNETLFYDYNEKHENNIKWGSNETDDLTRFDYGIITGVGIIRNSLLLELSYIFGMRNISNVGYRNNRVISISLGYIF